MGLCTELRNLCLIRELERELNNDVLLFGFDGLTYFGWLQNIEDCRIATLVPARVASSNFVQILTPGGTVQNVEFARVDLWQIVARASGIIADPFIPPVANARPEDEQDSSQRLDSCDLIRQLNRMVGEDVVLTTFGGFVFQGVLSKTDDRLAFLTVDEILLPGIDVISSDDVRSVVVNLEALTSIARAVDCCQDIIPQA
ncbi:hypothetical protein [Acetonema longum]|uniref:Uncharacterized protein n=1 Tax=Acetonema longum DSM 6540 TaxID=1009370 RepID=F7NEM3_9FIRM|nr:hypothetical protein [Acetonema longum]EGO65434.1 hypothetical protein ALO_02431 [Acetonema longum DSM 6540]